MRRKRSSDERTVKEHSFAEGQGRTLNRVAVVGIELGIVEI